MELDDRMRRRIGAAAEEAERARSPLDAATIDRIVTTAQDEMRRSARMRRIRRATVGVALAAAAGTMLVVSRPESAAPASPVAHVPRAPRCSSMDGLPVVVVDGTPAHRELLGDRARVDAADGTRARIETPSGCESHVTLLRGSIAVWARDLAGGRLAVSAGDLEVIVHGTVFEVRASDDGSRSVSVREGRVEVHRPGLLQWLTAGQSVRVARDGTFTRSGLDHDAEVRLAGVLGDAAPTATVASAPAPSTNTTEPSAANPAPIDVNATLRAAEILFREGRIDEARRLFRQVGGTRGSTAEAALIRLGRLELRAGRPSDALRALADHRRRFPSGSMAAEARVAEAQALRALGRADEAVALERWVIEHRPDSPQANALRSRITP